MCKEERYAELSKAASTLMPTAFSFIQSAFNVLVKKDISDQRQFLRELVTVGELMASDDSWKSNFESLLNRFDVSLPTMVWDVCEILDEQFNSTLREALDVLKAATKSAAYDFLRMMLLYKQGRYDDVIGEFMASDCCSRETIVILAMACKNIGCFPLARSVLEAVAKECDEDLFMRSYLKILQEEIPTDSI
ncbi:MAG: hypothetical protein AB7F87_18460 [Oligoflexales bacterium]